jgi:phosphoglycolate phosphatase
MPVNSIKLLVFDWDGTLADSTASIVTAMQAAIIETGMECRNDDSIKDIIGLGLLEAVNTLFPDENHADKQTLVDQYRIHYTLSNQGKTILFPGVRNTLNNLKTKGYHLAIATGKSRKGLNNALMETCVEDYFHFSRCADEALSKPHPQMLLDIMDTLNVEPRQTVMIGDSEHDLLMAKNAGVQSIAATYGSQTRDRLLKYYPIACINKITDLIGWLV